MTFFNNEGNLYKVYFVWEDSLFYRYKSWAEAKAENHIKDIYLSARLYSTLYASDERIDNISFKGKPKLNEIKRFMASILDEPQFRKDRIHFSEWKKLRKEQLKLD